MSISNISEYYDTLSTLAASMQKTAAAAAATDKTDGAEDGDSYVSTITDSSEAIPCENYNDILTVIAKNSAAEVSSEGTESDTGSGSVAAAGGGGSGSSDSDEEETTTEIVTINGVTYLETTTTVDGVTTTTRTVLSGDEKQDGLFADEEAAGMAEL
ncbi:MAG: hypothetical protein LUH14_07065 [Clostridiaceae bacterium]|nr:hypothetical protein [Clostridiaceae bacterium]